MNQEISTLKYSRLEDQIASGGEDRPGSIDTAPLLGTWVNTNPRTRGIVRAVLREDAGVIRLRVFGAGEPLHDWNEVPIESLYAKNSGSADPMAFLALYDFGFLETQVEANFSLGLMVIAALNTFKDGSGRGNYFSREFFRREPGMNGTGD